MTIQGCNASICVIAVAQIGASVNAIRLKPDGNGRKSQVSVPVLNPNCRLMMLKRNMMRWSESTSGFVPATRIWKSVPVIDEAELGIRC